MNAPSSAALPPLLPVVTGVWQQVLESSDFTADTHFFLAGGDSLQLTRVLLKLQQVCGVQLQLRDVAEFSTPRKMALWCGQRQELGTLGHSASTSDVERQATVLGNRQRWPDGQPYVASLMQQGMWLAEQRSAGIALYNTAVLLHLHGKLDVQVLEQALSVLLHKHPVLRTMLDFNVHSRSLLGKLSPFQPVFLQPETVDRRCLAELASQMAARPFVLSEQMYRFHLFRLSRDHHALLMCFHHALTDGWSAAVLLQSLAEAYNSLRVDPAWQALDIDTGFFDYCQQTHEVLNADCAAALGWWKQHLGMKSSARRDASKPGTHSRARWPFAVKTWQTTLPPDLLGAARTFCQQQHVTLFSCMLAALKLVLAHGEGMLEQVVGFPVAARSSVTQEASVGCYVNTLLTQDVMEQRATPALIQRVHSHVQDALQHALPLQYLVSELRPALLPSGNVWFDVLLAFQNLPARAVCLHGLRIEMETVAPLYSQYPLKVEVLPGEARWTLRIEYADMLFTARDTELLAEAMQRHLGAMVR